MNLIRLVAGVATCTLIVQGLWAPVCGEAKTRRRRAGGISAPPGCPSRKPVVLDIVDFVLP